eukprot:6027277-Pyramimonas_sp.AAC.8
MRKCAKPVCDRACAQFLTDASLAGVEGKVRQEGSGVRETASGENGHMRRVCEATTRDERA